MLCRNWKGDLDDGNGKIYHDSNQIQGCPFEDFLLLDYPDGIYTSAKGLILRIG
jgi:hypothetical protein